MRGWLVASVAALVVASPVVLISIGQRGQVSWLKPLDAAQIASVRQLLGPPALAATVLLVIVATFAFCALRGRLATDMPSRLLALSLPWLLLPPAVLLAASAVHPVYSLRYIVFCAPAAALLAGAGLAALGWAGGAVGLVLIVLVALPGQASDRRVGSHSENLRQLSHLVAVHSRPGDALLFPRLNDREFEAAYPAPYRPLRDVTLGPDPHPVRHPPRHPRQRLAHPQPPHHHPPPLGNRDRQRTRQRPGPQWPGLPRLSPLDSKRHLASALHPPRLRQATRFRVGRCLEPSSGPAQWQCGSADSAFLLPSRRAVLPGSRSNPSVKASDSSDPAAPLQASLSRTRQHLTWRAPHTAVGSLGGIHVLHLPPA